MPGSRNGYSGRKQYLDFCLAANSVNRGYAEALTLAGTPLICNATHGR
jgi:hypothetical protein